MIKLSKILLEKIESLTKKPIKVKGIKFTGDIDNIEEIKTFLGKNFKGTGKNSKGKLVIKLKTLESDGETQNVDLGDYIVKGAINEFYPVKPEDFKKTFKKS